MLRKKSSEKSSRLARALKTSNFDGKDIRIIADLYWGQVAVVRTDKGNSRKVSIKRGTRQGCVLSPYLFNLPTEMVVREVNPSLGVSIGGKRLSNLRYADDTALMSETETELQCIVDRVNEVGKDFGMKMNVNKTISIVVSRKDVRPRAKMYINEQLIE